MADVFDYDAELQRHNERFRTAAQVGSRDHVLDIGCGTGLSTREAARAAPAGRVLGVDTSAPMLERARQISDAEGLTNVAYEIADAQVHPFPPVRFDLCISRFGTMFFADPLAAFTNIASALRPEARLVMLVWQERDRNEWASVRQTLTGVSATPSGPNAFSLGDPAVTEGILTGAGFTDVDFSDVHEPVYYGPDGATALDAMLRLLKYEDLLADLDASAADAARARLRTTLEAHETADGVYFDSRAWIVTARRM
jgi:SAM-dependent methyltransferase